MSRSVEKTGFHSTGFQLSPKTVRFPGGGSCEVSNSPHMSLNLTDLCDAAPPLAGRTVEQDRHGDATPHQSPEGDSFPSRGSQGLSLFLEKKTDRQSRDGRVVMNRPHQCHPEAQPKDL
jgi:hypothetical protein